MSIIAFVLIFLQLVSGDQLRVCTTWLNGARSYTAGDVQWVSKFLTDITASYTQPNGYLNELVRPYWNSTNIVSYVGNCTASEPGSILVRIHNEQNKDPGTNNVNQVDLYRNAIHNLVRSSYIGHEVAEVIARKGSNLGSTAGDGCERRIRCLLVNGTRYRLQAIRVKGTKTCTFAHVLTC